MRDSRTLASGFLGVTKRCETVRKMTRSLIKIDQMNNLKWAVNRNYINKMNKA